MLRSRTFLALALVFGAPLLARADDAQYRTPPAAVADLLTAPRLPRAAASVSPDGRWLLQPDLRSLIPISTLAEPVDKLAGFEVLQGMHTLRGSLKNAAGGLSIVRVADGVSVRAKLPADARLGGLAWSSKGDRVACVLHADGGAQLWIVDAATGETRRVDGVRLQTVTGGGVEWANDDRSVFVALVPEGAGALAAISRVPTGPAVRLGAGRATPQRTARDVLHTPEEQARFAGTVSAQLARVWLEDGRIEKLGTPVALDDWSVSPDERWLLVTRYRLPVALGFPAYLFPTTVEAWPVAGGAAVKLADVPLNDRSAVASVAPLGRRNWTWTPDGRSLWLVEWRDRAGADAQKAVRDTALAPPGEDHILRWDAPFDREPVEVATGRFPVEGMAFTGDGSRLFVWEGYEPRRHERQWWLATSDPKKRGELVLRSSEGAYDAPGTVLIHFERHEGVVWTTPDGKAFYRSGQGFRADGQRPFLDRWAFESSKRERVFESDAAHLEQVTNLLSADARRFVTLRQSQAEPPNYFLRRAGESSGMALTAYTNPAQALSDAQRVNFTFTREDGVKLNAQALLPAGWKQSDPPLPTIFWIYPNDFRSAVAASQNRTSPNRFPSQSALNPEVLVTQGYAVVQPDLAIVGTNDQYVAELRKSATAAVEECARRGFTDRDRVGVGGHSYGAFSTVNCLAHTRLFKAGLASDGAYNRTLTPFTFQAETRNLWDARDTYLQMSPFLYANQIEAPLLLAHNLDDTNVGTNPIQSERLFEALNGLGKTVQLVQYPYEDHGPVARETVLDYWARAVDWFDRYVKNAKRSPAAQPMGGTQP